MRSVLTRRVFRALLANRPYNFADCSRLKTHPWPSLRHTIAPTETRKRHIFGLSMTSTQPALFKEGARRSPENLNLALSEMVDLVRARRTQSKPPSLGRVAEALNFFFRACLDKRKQITRNEIFLATEAVKHLQEQRSDGKGAGYLKEEDLQIALSALALTSGKDRFRSDTKALAYLIAQEARARMDPDQADESYFQDYITVLSRTGGAPEARALLDIQLKNGTTSTASMWIPVLKGFAAEGLRKDFWKTVSAHNETGGSFSSLEHEDLFLFVAELDDFDFAKNVYQMELKNGAPQSLSSIIKFLELCMRYQRFNEGNAALEIVRSQGQSPLVREAIVKWHAARGMSLDQIEAFLAESSIQDETLTLTDLNAFLDYSYSCDDLAAANSCFVAFKQRHIKPDANTYIMQMSHQIQRKDLNAATTTFELLQSEDIPADNSDFSVLNKYLTAVCFSPSPPNDLVTRLVDLLLDRSATCEIESETVAALCHHFLARDELQEAVGILRHRVDFFPFSDRARVAAIFISFITSSTTPVHRAFNAYELFRHAFPETTPSERLPLMHNFFARSRPDLACLVFGHMRQRDEPSARPDSESYAQCFEGIAKSRDIDGLQMVYNMLKLDLEVEQTTRIHNSLMVAYTACQQPFTSIIDHFWKIMDSREGPTMSSFALALRACESWVPQGAMEARRIIAMMQAWQIPITKEIYHCYIGALAGNSEFENCVELIEEMEDDIGERPDFMTLGTFYNAIPWQYRKDEVESWAKQWDLGLWEELESMGEEIDEEWEVRYFKIDREIRIDDEKLWGEGEYEPQLAKRSQILLESPPDK